MSSSSLISEDRPSRFEEPSIENIPSDHYAFRVNRRWVVLENLYATLQQASAGCASGGFCQRLVVAFTGQQETNIDFSLHGLHQQID
jgi:hypothetical protein